MTFHGSAPLVVNTIIYPYIQTHTWERPHEFSQNLMFFLRAFVRLISPCQSSTFNLANQGGSEVDVTSEFLISQPLLFTPITPFSPTTLLSSFHLARIRGNTFCSPVYLQRSDSASRKEAGLVGCNKYLLRQPSTQCAPCEVHTFKNFNNQFVFLTFSCIYVFVVGVLCTYV